MCIYIYILYPTKSPLFPVHWRVNRKKKHEIGKYGALKAVDHSSCPYFYCHVAVGSISSFIYLSIYPSIHPSIYLSNLSIYLINLINLIYLSIYLINLIYLSI